MMPNRATRYYWDANVFITLISNSPDPVGVAQRQVCTRLMQQAIDGDIQIVTSVLTIAEVLDTQDNPVKPVPAAIRQRVCQLFDEPYITIVALDEARAGKARDLRWAHPKLSTIDAVHVASALYAEVDELQTYDGSGKPAGLITLDNQVGSPPLRIVTPNWQGNLPLFGRV